MKRILPVSVKIVVVGVLLFIVIVIVLTLLSPSMASLAFIVPLPIDPPDIQPTVAYLSEHPESPPDGLWLEPSPRRVKKDTDACITLIYLPCDGQENRAGLPPEQNHCGHSATITIDGRPAFKPPYSLGDIILIDGRYYSDAHYCLKDLLVPGSHVLTVDAYPIGRSARYSWVWTVEP